MTNFLRLALPAILLAGAAPGCKAQAMAEYGSAASVGALGSAGGKKLSDAIDRVLAGARDAAGRAAAKAAPKASPARPAPPASTARSSSPALPRPHATETPRPEPPAPPPAGRSEIPPPAGPTAEAFARIAPGASRSDLAAALGPPSFRIVIPDGAQLVEIYHYSSHGAGLASIRLVNGTLAEIRPTP